MALRNDNLGVAAWVLGVHALGFAILLRLIFLIPLPSPVDQSPHPESISKGKLTLEWDGTKVVLGRTKSRVDPPPVAPKRELPLVLVIAINTLAVTGIFVGSIAIWRERTYALGGPAILFCLLALLVHYVLLAYMTVILIIAVLLLIRVVVWP